MLIPDRHSRPAAGFTLIEVMVGVSIMGILLALGMPAFSNYMGNAKLRASAASFHAAAQFARAEAIKRNGGVEIILTDDDPTAANKDTNNLSLSGRNWMVRSQDPGAATFTLLQGKSAQEGGNVSSVVVNGSPTFRVMFNGLGGTNVGAAAAFSFTSANGACAGASGSGPMRCLDVRISTTGQTRLCDPLIVTAGDSRGCN
jgi:type IV fimbrial biogenesis protein FimT